MTAPARALRNPAEMPFREFAPTYLHIAPKAGGIIPFELNDVQLRLDDIIEARLEDGRPVRILVLKARQGGISTLGLGYMYQYATTQTGVTTFLAAHDDDSTRELFERSRMMYDLAPAKPMMRYSTKTELDFANPDRDDARSNPGLQSKIRIGTAGKTRLGRSKTLRFIHCSEVAFWPDAKRVLLGLEQALPDDPGTVEIIESTANGVGGEFHRRWKLAENPKTRGEWIAVFFAWFEFMEYTRKLEGGELNPIPSCITDVEAFEQEERFLQASFKLTPEQINWRRWAIVNKCGNDIALFRQEYPSNAEEAFLTSGRPIFNRERLAYRLRELQAVDLRLQAARKPPRGLKGKLIVSDGKVRFLLNPDGPLTIYRYPEPGREYIIGADPCKGAVKSDDPDSAEAHVYDRHTWEQVAVYRDREEATEFAKVLENLGYYYYSAMLVPEANDHGHTVCVTLQERSYPNMYLRQDFDELGMVPIEKAGWENNRKTKPILVDSIDGAINDNVLVFNDEVTIQQHMTFVRDPRNPQKMGGDEGCHDDAVIATGLAVVVMTHGPALERKFTKIDPDKNHPDAKMVRNLVAAEAAKYRQAWRARFGESGGDDLLGWGPRD